MLGKAKIGIIGGSGQLGRAILDGLFAAGDVSETRLWVSNRSGARGDLPEAVRVTRDIAELVASCDVILLSIPPAAALKLRLAAEGKLVLSVMAGVALAQLAEIAGHDRVIRAMSSPAAADRLAYSPYVTGGEVRAEDCALVEAIFGAVGMVDRLQDEHQIDVFTAMTGPVPGFVALYAAVMAGFARAQGVDPDVADRAVRQLFKASGHMLGAADASPATHVQAMVDYAGTTAAGIDAMKEAGIARVIETGLAAAVDKTRRIASED
ncbi:pyrroline-5-carboxylate reductase family protein [Aliiroseovarius marinus]|uniref:pyrroline-5-carboxylate reductase family protein n=1 Tax=Aliiroseovarius marinus TaxID=2500159 RepID=UPI003D7C4F52